MGCHRVVDPPLSGSHNLIMPRERLETQESESLNVVVAGYLASNGLLEMGQRNALIPTLREHEGPTREAQRSVNRVWIEAVRRERGSRVYEVRCSTP